MFGKHKKEETQEELLGKADRFDRMFRESRERAEGRGRTEPLPVRRDWRGRPISE